VALAAGALAAWTLAAATLGEAHPAKPQRICHRRHHRRVCRTVKRKPRRPHTTTTTSTTTSATSTSSSVTSSTSATATQTTTTLTSTTTSSGPPPLPHGTEIDERATGLQSPFYALDANERALAAGAVHFNIYNFDQDPHTFAVANANGQQLTTAVQDPAGHPGTAVTLTVNLTPGTYTLFCTLPQHAADGMETTVVVK
jgi:Copper binding proteins, plastocyanin/azurin family